MRARLKSQESTYIYVRRERKESDCNGGRDEEVGGEIRRVHRRVLFLPVGMSVRD